MKRQRAFLIFCFFLGLTIIICIFWKNLIIAFDSTNYVYCYWSKSNDITELGEGEWDIQMLIPSRCIFFHETTCSLSNFTPRQACAVESAARNNHNLNVFLLFLTTEQFSNKSKELINILETYNNVYIRRINLLSYIFDTPIENWFWSNIRGLWNNQNWLHKDFHDYVRMLTLWKFGGLSLNLNSVILTSLDELTTFAGVQDDHELSIGVFGVDTSTNFGRSFVDTCMEIIKDIDTNNYSHYNITRIITKAVWKLCYQQNINTNKECRRFSIYSPAKFYPAFSNSWRIHSNDTTKGILKMQKDVMTIHWRNDHNRTGETVAVYKMAAKQHCPKIYKFTGESFLSSH